VRQNPVASEHVRVLESTVAGYSTYTSSAVRNLRSVAERVSNLEMRDLRLAGFFSGDSTKYGFPAWCPAAVGQLKILVGQHESAATHIRQLAVDAESALTGLLRSFNPATLTER
jgi:hypothetical protein